MDNEIHRILFVLFLFATGINGIPTNYKFQPCYLPSSEGLESDNIRAPCPPPQKTKTLIIVILDESGSMSSQKSDVIGGYNSFIEQQKEIKGDTARLILIKFNTHVTVEHGATELNNVQKLTNSNYRPMEGTALYDAVEEGVKIAEGAAQDGERVLVIVMTDGEENSSRKSSAAQIRSLISRKESLGNWTFAYIGENPDAWAKEMKQSVNNVRPYDFHHQGNNLKMASEAVSKFRAGAAPQSMAVFA